MSRRRQWHPTPVLLPGKSHGWRSLVGCSPWGHWESDTTEQLHFHFSLSCIGEGNGNPLQYSCLENPMDGEPGGLPSLGSHRVGHDWSDFTTAALYLKKHNVYLNFKIFYCLKMPTIIWDFSKLYLFASRGSPIDAEDCWLIRVVVAEGWGGCGNFLK